MNVNNKVFMVIMGCSLLIKMAPAVAEDGRLSILGGISAVTCTVSPDDQYKVIRLPFVGPKSLAGAGATAGDTRFSIKLVDCPAALKKAGIYFENGPSVEAETGFLKAYKLGNSDPVSPDGSGKQPDFYENSANTKVYSDSVIAESGQSSQSQNLRFELVDKTGKKVNVGDTSQSGAEGLMTQLTESSGKNIGVITGSVRYHNLTATPPEAGYYFSHVGFVIQYP